VHRIISKYQPAVDPVHLLTTVLRRDMCKRIVLTADGNHVRLADASVQILRQLEFFFGDANYFRDTYLQSLAEEGEDNFVPLEKVCAFRSMQVRLFLINVLTHVALLPACLLAEAWSDAFNHCGRGSGTRLVGG
jgi:hypothetical protein